MSSDHVVFRQTDQAFACLHCGATYQPAIPCPLNLFTSMCEAFTEDHKNCKEKDHERQGERNRAAEGEDQG